MAAPDELPVHRVLQAVRRRKGWTQVQLAEAISVTQPAISRFETDGSGLSEGKIEAIADVLDVDLDSLPEDLIPPDHSPPSPILWYCPNYDCPSSVPYVVAGRTYYAPAMVRAATERRWCRYCGEVMLSRCQGCRAPAAKGAFCSECGRPYVRLPRGIPPDVCESRERAAADRARIQGIRRMTEVEAPPPGKRRRAAKPQTRGVRTDRG